MGLCLPRRRMASCVHRRPSVLSVASTTYQSPRTVSFFAKTVDITKTPTTGRSPHICRPKIGWQSDWRAPGKRGASVLNAPEPLQNSISLRRLPIIAAPWRGGPNLDTFISAADRALRALLAPPAAGRPVPPAPSAPRDAQKADAALSADDRRESAALMRVNHAGEVAAQALYHAQALFARDPEVREFMLDAAREETDHLAWCETGSRSSAAAPACSIRSGMPDRSASARSPGCSGDRPAWGSSPRPNARSKGICRVTSSDCRRDDLRRRAIVEAMCEDEVGHGQQAQSAGGSVACPAPVRELMRRTAEVMTHTAIV